MASLTNEQLLTQLNKIMTDMAKSAKMMSQTQTHTKREHAHAKARGRTDESQYEASESGRRKREGGLLSGLTSTTHKAMRTAANHVQTGAKHVRKASGHVSDTLLTLAGGADSLGRTFKDLAAIFVGGKIVEGLDHTIERQIDGYRELTNIGQTFGGSMIEMSRQAAAAGMPLAEFSKMVGRNSTASATMANNTKTGSASMAQMAKQVRDSTRDFGFYGMSLDDMNGLTSDYSETLRQQGRVTEMGTAATSRDIASFAQDISLFSSVTGKSREEITKATNAALRDVSVTSRQMMGETSTVQNAALQKATAALASLPGEAGDILSKMGAQTFGSGSAALTEMGQEMIHAGGTDLLSSFQNLNDRTNAGDTSDESQATFLREFKQAAKGDLATIRQQAVYGHNPAAIKMLEIINQINSVDEKELASKRKEMAASQKFTQFFMTIASDLHAISGSFRDGLLSVIEKPLEEAFGPLNASGGALDQIKTSMSGFGVSIGNVLKGWITKDNVQSMVDNVLAFGGWMQKATLNTIQFVKEIINGTSRFSPMLNGFAALFTEAGRGILDAATWIGEHQQEIADDAVIAITAVKDIATILLTPFKMLYGFLTKFTDATPGMAAGITALSAVLALMAGKAFMSRIFSRPLLTATLRANVVNVSGPGGGGGAGGLGSLGSGGEPHGGGGGAGGAGGAGPTQKRRFDRTRRIGGAVAKFGALMFADTIAEKVMGMFRPKAADGSDKDDDDQGALGAGIMAAIQMALATFLENAGSLFSSLFERMGGLFVGLMDGVKGAFGLLTGGVSSLLGIKPPTTPPTTPAKSATTEPAKAATTQPAKAAATEPAKPATTEPAKPATTEPAKPAATEPAKPATPPEPAKPSTPAAPATEPPAPAKPAAIVADAEHGAATVGKDAGAVADEVAKAGRIGGKLGSAAGSVAKFGAKTLPFIGAIGAAVSSISRFADGDWKGGIADGVSAALDATGIGSGLSLAIQGTMLTRDAIGREKFDDGAGSLMIPTDNSPKPDAELSARNDRSLADPTDDNTDSPDRLAQKYADLTAELDVQRQRNTTPGSADPELLGRIAQLLEAQLQIAAAQHGEARRYQRDTVRQGAEQLGMMGAFGS